MHEIVTCPSCKRKLQLPADYLGKQVQCPTCETTFTAATDQPRLPPRPSPSEPKPAQAAPAPAKAKDDWEERSRSRRQRRPDLPKKPAGTSPTRVVIGVVVAVAIVGCLIAVPVMMSGNGGHKKKPLVFNPPNFNPPNFNPGVLPPVVDVPDRILNAEEQKEQARQFFQHFSAVMRRANDRDGEIACFDAARLANTAIEEKLVPAAQMNDRVGLEATFRDAMTRTSLYRGEQHWNDYQIPTVKQTKPRELIVVTRHPDRARGTAIRLRWWLAHRDGRWKITEVEDVDYGIRLTLYLSGNLANADPGVRTVRDAADAVVMRVNFDEAKGILENRRPDTLPKSAAATYHLILAWARQRKNFQDDAIRSCEAAQGLRADMPGADYLRAVAYSNLARDELALKHARLAQVWLGDDPIVCFEMGLSLQHLGRKGEAAPQFRKVLDELPNHKDAFLGLIRCSGPQAQADDIAGRFLKMNNARDHFEEFARTSWQIRDVGTLKLLAEAMLRVDAVSADAHFYLSLVHCEQQRMPDGIAEIRNAISLQGLDVRREHYYKEFAGSSVFRDQAVQAYNGLPDRTRAFRALGEAMKNTGRLDELQQLIDAHAKNFAKDAYLDLFRADVYMRDEQFALADKAYTKAFVAINDAQVVERYRYNRIRARHLAGDLLSAYRDLGPAHLTFAQLAGSCWIDKKTDDLRKLVDAHRRNDPNDPQLPRYVWRLQLLDKQFAEAGKSLRAELARPQGIDQEKRVVQDFLFDAIDSGQALEGYRQAPSAMQAFEIIGGDLAGSVRGNDLDAVIKEHSQRFPKDPLLRMLEGSQAYARHDWAKAADAFAKGWKNLPEAKRQRYAASYLYARCKVGQAVQAYRDMGNRPQDFYQLASILITDKKIDAFEELLKAHRPQGALDPRLPAYEARLMILRGQYDQAATLMTGLLKDRPLKDQQDIGDPFLNDLAGYNVSVEAYRCLPDKRDAFSYMMWRYRTPERVNELSRLLAEHARQVPDDLRLYTERGELHLLKGDFAAAEEQFRQGMSKNPIDTANRFGLIRARIKLGKTADVYRELGGSTQAFLDIANQCVTVKDGAALEQLLAAHRKATPTAKNLAIWDIESMFLRKDYAGTVKAIQDDRKLLKNANTRWKCESIFIRSLVRQKKSDEAVKEAETLAKRKDTWQVLMPLALASTGDAARLLEYMDAKKGNRYFVEDCYRDEDLGPLLRSDAFQMVRDRYPPPVTLPNMPFLPGAPFDDDF